MIQILGIPFDANASFMRGSALAPDFIRLMETDGSANTFAENGENIAAEICYKDVGNIYFPNEDSTLGFKLIRSTLLDLLSTKAKIIAFGGDHSISFPVIDAFTTYYPQLHVLHFDAHADLYENFGNNPFSHASPFARILEKGNIGSLTQVGIRTLNTHQKEQAQHYGVKLIEMNAYHEDWIAALPSPLYISIDMDVLDPAFAPGVSHHEPGGMSTRTLLNCLQKIKSTVVGADIVELNPTRDFHNMTAMAAYKIFKEVAALMLRNP
ncbi:MAG: agmatinase [Ferruginibacter sp.]